MVLSVCVHQRKRKLLPANCKVRQCIAQKALVQTQLERDRDIIVNQSSLPVIYRLIKFKVLDLNVLCTFSNFVFLLKNKKCSLGFQLSLLFTNCTNFTNVEN